MPIKNQSETRLAHLELHDQAILIIRFKPATPLDVQGVSEVVQRRLEMGAGRKLASVTVLPEDLDVEVNVFITDHAETVKQLTLAEVCVSANVHHRRLAELYYSNFPQPFPTGVFHTEEEAIAWSRSLLEPVLE